MDADGGDTDFRSENADSRGGVVAVGWPFTERREKTLSRRPEQHGITQGDELVQVAQNLPVVVGGLGESQSRIGPQFGRRNPGIEQRVYSRSQFRQNVPRDVCVHGVVVHHIALTAPVHRDERCVGTRNNARHRGVGESTRNVVDVVDAKVEPQPRGVGPHRVERHRNPIGNQSANHGFDAPAFLAVVESHGSGASRFPTDIDNIGARLDHRPRVVDCGIGGLPETTITERIRRHVEDAEHDGTVSHRPGRSRRVTPIESVRRPTCRWP